MIIVAHTSTKSERAFCLMNCMGTDKRNVLLIQNTSHLLGCLTRQVTSARQVQSWQQESPPPSYFVHSVYLILKIKFKELSL